MILVQGLRASAKMAAAFQRPVNSSQPASLTVGETSAKYRNSLSAPCPTPGFFSEAKMLYLAGVVTILLIYQSSSHAGLEEFIYLLESQSVA